MSGLLKLTRFLTVVVVGIAGGMVLWNHKEKVKQTWDSLGGAEGLVSTANRLMDSAGPVRDFVNQMSHLK